VKTVVALIVTLGSVLLTLVVSAGGVLAIPPTVEILTPTEYAPAVPRIEARFGFEDVPLLYETVQVTVDGVAVRLDPEHDTHDNDGDGLTDEPGESIWSELTSVSALMRAWMPYALRADDPATPEDEGHHTICVGAYNEAREWGESESSFRVTSRLSGLDAYCYPNPFIPEQSATQLTYVLTSSAKVTVTIHDFAGQRLATICEDEWRDAGTQREPCDRWWGKNHRTDRRVPAGIYFMRVQADRNGQTENSVVRVGVLPRE
jgi:hypothetical protein